MAIRDLFLGGKAFQIDPPYLNAPLARPKPERRHLSAFSERLRTYVEHSGLSQEEFAEALSATLNRPIFRSRVASWLNSAATPRISEAEIFAGCEAVLGQADGTPQRVGAAEASATIKRYLEMGLTRKALCVAGQVAQSTLSQWEAGRVDVKARPWMRFVALADAYIAAMQKTGTL
jgi:transcriptional regulator with XRE-family HTH domain